MSDLNTPPSENTPAGGTDTGTTTSTITTTTSSTSTSNGRRARFQNPTIFATGETEFARQDPGVGVVIGIPLEQKLKYGASYDDFVASMKNAMTSKMDLGNKLIPMFRDLTDPQ